MENFILKEIEEMGLDLYKWGEIDPCKLTKVKGDEIALETVSFS